MPDLHDDFRAAAGEYTQRLRGDHERRENPRKATAENGDKFAAHMESILAARREESGIDDLLD